MGGHFGKGLYHRGVKPRKLGLIHSPLQGKQRQPRGQLIGAAHLLQGGAVYCNCSQRLHNSVDGKGFICRWKPGKPRLRPLSHRDSG